MPQQRSAVSVGIPFFNAGKTLIHAVRSVFAQTFQDWELILVDDGSTDEGSALVRGIRDPRVRLYVDNRRLGLAERLNQIAQLARGEYLARMDADDLMHPERLRRQVDALRKDSLLDLVGTAAYVIDDLGTIRGTWGLRAVDLSLFSILRRVPFVHPTVMGKVEWFRKHPYDAGFDRAEDHELWSRACGHLRAVQIQEPLLFYRHQVAGTVWKYMRTYQTDRRIVWLYGRHGLGLPTTALLVAESHCREWIHLAAAALGVRGALFRLRDGNLTVTERAAAQGDLNSILGTEVPGVDTPRCAFTGIGGR